MAAQRLLITAGRRCPSPNGATHNIPQVIPEGIVLSRYSKWSKNPANKMWSALCYTDIENGRTKKPVIKGGRQCATPIFKMAETSDKPPLYCCRQCATSIQKNGQNNQLYGGR